MGIDVQLKAVVLMVYGCVLPPPGWPAGMGGNVGIQDV